VNSKRNIKREVILWLGLFAALIAGGVLMSHKDRETDLPKPVQAARNGAVPEAFVQSVKNTNRMPTARQLAEPAPEKIRTMNSSPEEAGYESPFSGTNQAPEKTSATQADPTKLRAALTAAAASGNVRDLAALLHSGDSTSEIEAVRLLAQIGGGEALAAALGKVLTVPADSPDYNKFISAFADCHSAAVADWLTGFLGQTQTDDVRQRLLTVLAALHGPEVVDSLASGLVSPVDAMHAKDCAELLAKASDPGQAALLRDLLETGKSADTQTAAARGLASIGSGEACAALIEAGSSDKNVAAACRDALASVKSSYGQEALIQAVVNPNIPTDVRIAAAEALSNQPGQRTQTVLANLATSEPVLQAAIKQTLQTIKQSGTPPQSRSALGNAGIDGELWF
jgi:aminopeptidase N